MTTQTVAAIAHHFGSRGAEALFSDTTNAIPEAGCVSGADEEIAYQAQDLWLRFHKQTLFDEFNMDPITLKVRTSCF